jgi:hypothetical protein
MLYFHGGRALLCLGSGQQVGNGRGIVLAALAFTLL